MSAVLKASVEEGRPPVQAFSERLARGGLQVSSEPAPVREDPEVTALKLENSRLADELQKLEAEAVEAVRAAREEGREQAAAEFRRDETAALNKLSAHLDDAFTVIRGRIEAWEAVSLAVAQTALSKIVCAPERYDELLTGMIRAQIEQVRRESILQVRVSQVDFPDRAALEALESDLQTGSLQIVQDDSISRGSCVLALRIGEVESALDLKWSGVVALFESLIEAERR